MHGCGALREMVLAVPGRSDDIYLRHQQVWQAMAPLAHRGQDFIFREEAEQLFRVRSATLPRWAKVVSLPATGRFGIDLVCATGESYREAVPDAELPAWVEAKLARHGFRVRGLAVQERAWRRGVKRVRASTRVERIVVPVATITGTYAVANPLLAQEAFASGIGRGKRFGFGFLRASGTH